MLANLSVAYFGPVSTPINAFLLIAFDLVSRDSLHERWNHKNLWLKMMGSCRTIYSKGDWWVFMVLNPIQRRY